MKPISGAITDILTTIQTRLKMMELAHRTIIKNLLEIAPILEKYKEYREISISLSGSIYIYLADDKCIRISNHATGKAATKKKTGLVENLIYGNQ